LCWFIIDACCASIGKAWSTPVRLWPWLYLPWLHLITARQWWYIHPLLATIPSLAMGPFPTSWPALKCTVLCPLQDSVDLI